jgi:hypothetical protein
MPLSVTVSPPEAVTSPPNVAVVAAYVVTLAVVTVGALVAQWLVFEIAMS